MTKTRTACSVFVMVIWLCSVKFVDVFPQQQYDRPPTPPNRPTTPPGCFYNNNHHFPGTMIEKGRDGNWCWVVFCDDDGKLLHGDDFNCLSTTTLLPTTSPPRRK